MSAAFSSKVSLPMCHQKNLSSECSGQITPTALVHRAMADPAGCGDTRSAHGEIAGEAQDSS
jgi:hypothetical protein